MVQRIILPEIPKYQWILSLLLFCSIGVIRIPSVVFAEHRNCLVTQSGSSHTQAAACTPGAECREEGRGFESFWAILKGDGNPSYQIVENI